MSDNTRVLVVDDSAVMLAILSDQIAAAPGLSVVGKARNGPEAISLFQSLQPDVVTLDVEMPGMSGLEVLDAILKCRPTPVIMVSGLAREGAAVTLDALERGAADCLAKPEGRRGAAATFVAELIEKIREVAGMNLRRIEARRETPAKEPVEPPRPTRKAAPGDCPPELGEKCVAIGISTGGPPALTSLLSSIRPPAPPIVIVQHMPPQFTGPMAARLDAVSPLAVREAAEGDPLQPNCVLVAPGGMHIELVRHGRQVKAAHGGGEPVSGHKPSIDVMMKSAAAAFGANCLGVIMTGMGRDGAAGCRAIRAAGGMVLGQDEATSDVYGMNKAAYVEGNVDQQFALHDAASMITRCLTRLGRPTSGACPAR